MYAEILKTESFHLKKGLKYKEALAQCHSKFTEDHRGFNYDPDTGVAVACADESPSLYLVRHGNTDLNSDNCMRGWKDVPLDEKGEEQADALGSFFKDKGIKHVYSSDLQRAKHTADKVGKSSGADVTEDDGLRPWNIGYLGGLSRDEHGDELDHFVDHPDETPKDGESLNDFHKRFHGVLNDYAKKSKKEGPIVLVSHASNLTTASQHFLNGEKSVDPGGVLAVTPKGKGYDAEVVYGKERSADLKKSKDYSDILRSTPTYHNTPVVMDKKSKSAKVVSC
jgi:broad specificity phosphatase PhoE